MGVYVVYEYKEDALQETAREIAKELKNNNEECSPFLLQKKLNISIARARIIYNNLKKE